MGLIIAGEPGVVVVPFMGESIEDGALIAILKRECVLIDGGLFLLPI